jgi:hypothetical protein
MKGATMLATLQRLGVVASFSRPRVSDKQSYSEALFRTLKYRPGFPNRRDKAILAARHRVYQQAKKQNPQRWSGETRDWSPAPSPILKPHQVISAQTAA